MTGKLTAEVTEEEGRNYANQIGAIFYLTSIKDGNNINELFHDIALKVFQKDFQYENLNFI